jgi:hypothetical protein
MKKDIQILWSACKYHWRRFKKLFKDRELLHDDRNNYYYDGDYQRVLYWRAYHRWQKKRFDRGQCNIGTDLFEQDTNISDNIKK